MCRPSVDILCGPPLRAAQSRPNGAWSFELNIGTPILVFLSLCFFALSARTETDRQTRLVLGVRRPHSTLMAVWMRTNTRLGDRSFAVAAPRLWNSLPAELRQPNIELEELRRLLKTFLFMWDTGAYVDSRFCAPCKYPATTTATTTTKRCCGVYRFLVRELSPPLHGHKPAINYNVHADIRNTAT